ncbi:MAG: PD-(D/E)XK nuclease-like domain-containing protein, partial [Alistipes sp.]
GLPVKIRPDAILLEENFGFNAIISFKTTSATSVETFLRDCAKYQYELSEGMYLKVASEVTGRKFTATLMVMIQTVIPFQVAVLFWDAEDLQVGKYKYAQALDIVKQCKDTNSWLGFDAKAEEGAHGIIQSKLPDYIKLELLPQYIP